MKKLSVHPAKCSFVSVGVGAAGEAPRRGFAAAVEGIPTFLWICQQKGIWSSIPSSVQASPFKDAFHTILMRHHSQHQSIRNTRDDFLSSALCSSGISEAARAAPRAAVAVPAVCQPCALPEKWHQWSCSYWELGNYSLGVTGEQGRKQGLDLFCLEFWSC